jgi:acetyl-CoA carboxylase biotin carboxyl carrier protein
MNDKLILALIDKFEAGSIAELNLKDETSHLILRKAPACNNQSADSITASVPHGTAVPADGLVHLGLSVKPAAEAAGAEQITSPIVATYYAAPGPDAPPFVKAGSRIKAGDTLCILEAMKMMNHLEAEYDCEILEVHVSSGDLVEYGQNLFTVKRL